MKKRLLSTLLILVMVFSALSATAFAADSVVEVADKAALTSAINAATNGTTIKLIADIDYGTDQLKIEKAITLDLGGKTLTTRNAYGGMSLKNGPSIKNGTIVHASNTAAIKAWNVGSFEDLTIDVQGKGDANKTIGGIVIQENAAGIDLIKNVTIKGDALTNGIETYNCGNATAPVIGSMENVTIDAAQTGMLISAPCGTATDCSISGGVSGIEIWIKGTYSASLELVDCEVEGGEQAVYAHDEFNSNPDIVNNGELELTADSATTFDSDTGALLALTNAHTSDINVSAVTENAEAKVVDANGTETYYATVEDAEDAADTDAGETVENLKLLEIWDVDDLAAFGDAVNDGDTFEGKTVKLMADVDLAGIEWTPIGNDTNYFMGTFDGGNHTISNMTIDIESTGDVFAGLFGGIKKATVKNLTMTNVSITAVGAKVRAATIAGIAHSNSENRTDATINFENITVDGCTINAEATSSSAMVGGIAGYCYPANMKNISVSDLTINGKAAGNNALYASAMAGYVCGQNISNGAGTRAYMTVEEFDLDNIEINAEAYTVLAGGYTGEPYYGYITFNNGDINGLKITVDAHEAFVGGLVGYFWRSDNGHTVNNVNITGINFDVTTDYLGETRIGGMVGTSQSVVGYKDCSVAGTITERCSDSENPVNYHAKVGGFVGRAYTWAQTYENCVADVDVTGSHVAGGFIGNHITNASYTNCEAKGDVTANIAGGFAGRLTENGFSTAVTFDGCSASGDVTGTNVAGGFIGSTVDHGWAAWEATKGNPYAKAVTLKDCEATGTVTSGTDYCAGLVGEAVMAEGVKLILDDSTVYPIEPACYPEDNESIEVIEYVAQINDEKYLTLTEAIEAAQNGDTIELIGDHSTTSEIVIPADMELTIDASAADFGELENVKMKIGRIVDSTSEFENGKSGEYTLTGFKLNGSLSVGTSATILTVSDCELEALDLNASNSTVIVEGNKINSTSGNKRFDGGNSDFGLYVYADQIDLTVKNNEIEAVDSAIVVQGNWPYFLSGENSISIFDNKLRTEEGNIFSTWNFNTYAPVEWPDEYQITDEMKALTKQIIEENNLAGMCEKDIVKVLCRANGVSDISVTEKHELLKDVADMSGLHSWGDWEVTKYPTMYAEGEETRYCTVDGCDGYETRTLAKLPYVPADPVDPAYTITVEDADNGSIKVSTSRASKGQTVTITVTPDAGYTLETLNVLNQNGKEIELTYKGDGKYTFKMPASKVTVYATFMEDNTMLNYFTDVFASDYYYDAVLWAVENGITNGTSATTFSPDAVCTRAQVVTFLWRAAGSPEPVSTVMPFTDVAADAYYYKAVLWAVENGITNGTSATTFSPDADCTRGQIVTFLWRSQGSENASGYNPFVDVANDAYYTEAVLWAVENGITNGTGANTFSPDADCTRGQIVTFLYRCLAE